MTASSRAAALRALALALALTLLARPGPPASAQLSPAAVIDHIDVSAFPDVQAWVAVSLAGGERMRDLPATAFNLLENNAPVPVVAVSEEEVGLQLAFVVESSNVFSKRDPRALTRLDHVKTAIIQFAVGRDGGRPFMKDSMDEVSLYAPEGPILERSVVGGEIRNALIAYQSEYRFETGLFTLIRQAMEAVNATPARPGMRRLIVIFTSGIDATADAEITVLVGRAAVSNITFHTVMVGQPGSANSEAAENVRALAALSGGSFYYFENPDALTPLWAAVASQRMQYHLTYRSALAQSGRHTLQALVDAGDNVVSSPPSSFSLSVLPPTVSFVEVPAQIVRRSDEAGADPGGIEPQSQTLSVQVEFPDRHPRALTKIQLLVDNTVAAEKMPAEAFDTLEWDLTGYADTGLHGLQVLAVDELGLEARSNMANVLVRVEVPPSAPEAAMPFLLGLVGIGLTGVAIAALAMALIVYFRKPSVVTHVLREAGQRVKEVTEPFIPSPGSFRPRRGKAYLEIVEGSQSTGVPIELTADNTRLGRDDTLAQVVFHDRSVSRLHARITEEAHHTYFIHDEGSTSGTWVNYGQVPVAGQQLHHGDLINLGRVQLRFMRHVPAAQAPQPVPADVRAAPGPALAWPASAEDPSTEPFQLVTPARADAAEPNPGPAEPPGQAAASSPAGRADDPYSTEVYVRQAPPQPPPKPVTTENSMPEDTAD